MLKLYDSNKNFLKNISNYKDLRIESELANGDKTLSFTYRGKPPDIENEMYIQTETDRYVVKEVRPADHATEYVCKLDLEELEASMFQQFTAKDQTAKDAADLAVAGTQWIVVSSMTKRRSVQQFKKTPYDILIKIRDAFMCEIRFDNLNQVVYLEEEFGDDKGVYLRSELNLKSVNLTLDSYDYYTRIIPIGADGLRITSVNDGKEYVENHQYSDKIRTLIWEDTSYEDAQTLKEDAEDKLADMSKPKRSYSAEVRDLAKLSGKYSAFAYALGDTVTIVDEPSGIKDAQRIVKMTEYPDDPEDNTVELSNTVLSWEELQDRVDAAANAWEDISNADGTVNGVYVHGVQAGDVVGIKAEIADGIDSSETIGDMKITIQENSDDIAVHTEAISSIGGDVALIRARIGTVEATYLRVADADIKYADIDFANIDTANINKAKVRDLFTEVGLIKQAVISEGHITGFLDAVQVNAASITAGTLIADRILLRGSNQSLVYALNNFGELTSTQVNTIDGYVLTDRTVNADKIIAHSITAYEITAENLIGANGWINLAQGTFNYGNALIWDGNQLTVSGVVTASGGAIGGFTLGNRYIESTATISGTTYRGWLEKNSGLSTNFFWGVQVNGTPKAYVRYDGYFYANNANITGDITATSLTAQNVYYLHDSAGTKKAVLASSDLEFRDNAPVVNIGTGFTYVNIKNNLFTNGQLMVGANGGGHLWCGNFYGGGIEIVNSSITGVNSLTANGNIKSTSGSAGSFYASSTGTNEPGFCCENGGRKGVFYVSSSYALGIYDVTNSSWVIYSGTNQTVNIPHLLHSYNEGYTTLHPVIGTKAGTNAIGVIVSNAATVGFYGRWGGGATAAMSGRTISCPSSDIRLKDNVQQSEVDALSVINQIRMRQFDWKDRQEHWDVGFVADELEQIDPLLSIGGGTDEDGNPMYKSVNDFYLLGYLTKAVQELSAENARLKKRVSHLEAA